MRRPVVWGRLGRGWEHGVSDVIRKREENRVVILEERVPGELEILVANLFSNDGFGVSDANVFLRVYGWAVHAFGRIGRVRLY